MTLSAITEHLNHDRNARQKEAQRSSSEQTLGTRGETATPPLPSAMATPTEVDVVVPPPDAAFQGRLESLLECPVEPQMLHSIKDAYEEEDACMRMLHSKKGTGVKALKTKLQVAKEQKNQEQIAAIEQELAEQELAAMGRRGRRKTQEFPGQRDAGVGGGVGDGTGWILQDTYLVPPCVCANCVRKNRDLPLTQAKAWEAAAEEGRGEEEGTNSRYASV